MVESWLCVHLSSVFLGLSLPLSYMFWEMSQHVTRAIDFLWQVTRGYNYPLSLSEIYEGVVVDFHAFVAWCMMATGVRPWMHVSFKFEIY
jgi:hypothetical protein